MSVTRQMFRWVIDFGPMIGQKIWVETHDGFRRSGLLQQVKFLDLRVLGVEVSLPNEIVLDDGFVIPFTQLREMKLVDG